jgi:hypothetical protein
MEIMRELLGDSGGVLPEDKAQDMLVRAIRVMTAGSELAIRAERYKQEGLRLMGTAIAGAKTPELWKLIREMFGVPNTPEEGGRYQVIDSPPATSKLTPEITPSKGIKRKKSDDGSSLGGGSSRKDEKIGKVPYIPREAPITADMGIDRSMIPKPRNLSKGSVYECLHCDTRSTNFDAFCVHLRKKHINQIITCHLCGLSKSFFSVKAWKIHMTSVHGAAHIFPPPTEGIDMEANEAERLLDTLGVNLPM